jgi:hypothetical protein
MLYIVHIGSVFERFHHFCSFAHRMKVWFGRLDLIPTTKISSSMWKAEDMTAICQLVVVKFKDHSDHEQLSKVQSRNI